LLPSSTPFPYTTLFRSPFTTDGPTTTWPAPAYYRWGYYNDPWYGNYNYYYQPYPAYPSASPWLTDYILSENLRAAYEASLAGKADRKSTRLNSSHVSTS